MSPLERTFQDFQRIWLGSNGRELGAEQQTRVRRRMLDFLKGHADVFERHHPPGHFTGSALVVDRSLRRVALCLHKKLGKWLQFGGHADGHHLLEEVALREAEEESGLVELDFVPYEALVGEESRKVPIDLDIHEIPAWKDVPAHYHYDVLYLLWTPSPEHLRASHESEAVAWYSFVEARELCHEENLRRCFDKIEWVRHRLLS